MIMIAARTAVVALTPSAAPATKPEASLGATKPIPIKTPLSTISFAFAWRRLEPARMPKHFQGLENYCHFFHH